MKKTDIKPSTITREFNAPRQLVFNARTQVHHLNNWMFPKPGCRCEFVQAEIKGGGTSLHKITMPNGHEMWLFTQYETVQSPDKLVFLQYMSNDNGEIVYMPHIPDWPQHMLATLLFEVVAEDRTQVTFHWEPRDPSAAELAAFKATRADHDKGWGAGMNQLEAYLAAMEG